MGAKLDEQTPPVPRPGAFSITWMLWIVFFVLVAYPLSTGPVMKLTGGGFQHARTIYFIYKPLWVLADHSVPADKFFRWYIFSLWHAG